MVRELEGVEALAPAVPCRQPPPSRHRSHHLDVLLLDISIVEDKAEGLDAFKHYEVERIIQRRDRKIGRGPSICRPAS